MVGEDGLLVEHEVHFSEAVEDLFGLDCFAGDPGEEAVEEREVVEEGVQVGELGHVVRGCCFYGLRRSGAFNLRRRRPRFGVLGRRGGRGKRYRVRRASWRRASLERGLF